MKKIILIILLTSSFLASAQTVTDKAVVEASGFVNAENYIRAIEILQKADKTDYRVQYFLILTEFKILKQSNATDFYSVTKVRDKAQKYLSKFSSKNIQWTENVKSINGSLDDINPAKNIDEYLANEKQKEHFRLEKLKTEKLKVLQEYLSHEDYQALRSTLCSYEAENLLEPYHINYYQSIAEYELLKMNDSYEISDVQSIKKQLNSYLTNYGTSNSAYSNSIQKSLNFLNENFASTQDELISKREELVKTKYKQKLKSDFDQIKQSYLDNYFTVVIQKSELYPADSEFSEEVNYYKVLSQYSIFIETNKKEFSDISQLRYNLEGFTKNKKFTNSSYKKNVADKLSYVDISFPKTIQEFNNQKDQAQKKLLKEGEEQQRLVNRIERKKSLSRRMSSGFFAIGYEGGTIAKYGIRIEKGGNSTIGFFLNARTSLVNEADLLSGKIVENKNEAVIGPSIKIVPWMFLNVGGGYGFYKFTVRNDYTSTMNVEKKDYVVGYSGVTFRLGSRINIIGGASFIDITEEFYTPEFTFGLTINLN